MGGIISNVQLAFRNMISVYFDISTHGKPVLKEYKCYFTMPTKLTIFATYGTAPSQNIVSSAIDNM